MALLAAVACPIPARAAEDDEPSWRDALESLSFNDGFAVRWWKVDGFYDLVNRLYATDTHGDLQLGLQLDTVLAVPRDKAALFQPDAPRTAFETGLVVPEKMFVRWNPGGGPLRLEGGDFYKVAGRGMGLSLNRNVDVDIDTTILGGDARLEVGALRFDAFGGVSNPQTVSMTFPNRIGIDVRDRIVGGRIEADAGPLILGVHGVRFEWDDGPPGLVFPINNERDIRHRKIDVDETLVAGAHVGASDILGHVDLYLEVDGARYRGHDVFLLPPKPRQLDGHAAYGSLTAYAGPFTFQVEGKTYREFEQINMRSALLTGSYEYVTPPTLEYELTITPNSQHAVDSTDITGTRLTAAWARDRFTVRARYAYFQDLGQFNILPTGAPGANLNENINAVTLGGEYRGQGGNYYQLTVGARTENRLHEPDIYDQLFHADADVIVAVGRDSSLEGKVVAYRELVWATVENPTDRATLDKREVILGFRPMTWIGITAFYDYNTDPLAGGGPLLGGSNGNLADHHYLAGEIDVRPRPNSVVRLFFGAQSGGLKCSGGTCRVLPPFEGARLTGTLRF